MIYFDYYIYIPKTFLIYSSWPQKWVCFFVVVVLLSRKTWEIETKHKT